MQLRTVPSVTALLTQGPRMAGQEKAPALCWHWNGWSPHHPREWEGLSWIAHAGDSVLEVHLGKRILGEITGVWVSLSLLFIKREQPSGVFWSVCGLGLWAFDSIPWHHSPVMSPSPAIRSPRREASMGAGWGDSISTREILEKLLDLIKIRTRVSDWPGWGPFH